jgi:preprotein translocase subunit SecG
VQVYLNIAQIIVSTALIVIIIFQARSSSAGSMFGGSDSSVYRTRRGVEKTIYNATIALSVLFFALALLNVLAAG